MTKAKPRIPPLPREQWTDEARAVFSFWGEPGAWENGSKVEKEMVMAQHPRLAIAFNTFGKHLLLDNTVPFRPRELMVLRTAWHQRGEYAWHFHVGYALQAGITLEEIRAIGEGPDSAVWDGKDEDRAVLRATDEMLKTNDISDATWTALSRFYNTQQLMDLVFSIGAYAVLGWATRAFRIDLGEEIDVLGFDLKTASGKDPEVRFRPGERADWADTGN